MPNKEKSRNLFIGKGLDQRSRHDDSDRMFVIHENSRTRWRNFAKGLNARRFSRTLPGSQLVEGGAEAMKRETEAAHILLTGPWRQQRGVTPSPCERRQLFWPVSANHIGRLQPGSWWFE